MLSRVLILDFGSQYTQLIARRIRELGVYSEIYPCTQACTSDLLQGTQALILSGGPASVTDDDAPFFDKNWLEKGLPTLGICYGMHLLAHLQGGTLGQGATREYGLATLEIKNDVLFEEIPAQESRVWMSHGDHVEVLPEGFSCIGKTGSLPLAVMKNQDGTVYGVQFHPEVSHSLHGKIMLENFLFKIARCKAEWSPARFIEEVQIKLKAQLDEAGEVVLGLSGGVDSTVTAVLLHKVLGQKLHCIFVDNGLLREGEQDEVRKMLGEEGLRLPLTIVNAQDEFLEALEGVTDPEVKRKRIGHTFIEIFDREASRIGNVTHLAQGTLYPDVIESVSVRGPSVTIKTHHNVGGLPERMKLKLVEPLRELFKDEVRKVGETLGIPHDFLYRHPFPGPGLAVRILENITRERLDMVKKADAILNQEMRRSGWYEKVWQSFAVLLPIHTVGVMGDNRTYEQVIALRVIHSLDGMTADWVALPEDLLRTVSARITNEVKGINRVVYDISSKPPATIEWE